MKTLINDQVLVDPFLESLDDARKYFESRGVASRRIERLKFDTIGRWAFQDTFPYTIKQVTVEEPGG